MRKFIIIFFLVINQALVLGNEPVVAEDYKQTVQNTSERESNMELENPSELENIEEDIKDINTNSLTPIEKLLQEATSGNSHAQHILGILYLTGTKVEKDAEEALAWIQKAAALDHPIASYNLGVIYLRNLKNKESLRQALFWLQKSATLKNPNAAFLLARLYSNNQKAPFNSPQSFYWLNQADQLGLVEVKKGISQLYISSNRSAGFNYVPSQKNAESSETSSSSSKEPKITSIQ